MIAYRTVEGTIVEHEGAFYPLPQADWDDWARREGLAAELRREIESVSALPLRELTDQALLPPIGQQEVWAAGVTYLRSRSARMEESESAGGGSFYDRVYDATRPELFLKATPGRVIGHRGQIRIRRDSKWNVPEPELALFVNAAGEIVGYTIGNDVSSRDIEGENPLYLPQAKFYDGACSLGPGILLADKPLPGTTTVEVEIVRRGEPVFHDETVLSQMKRTHTELVEYLYRETSFPSGCILLTGTGIIPEDSFTLQVGDEVRITIPPIGTLVNPVG